MKRTLFTLACMLALVVSVSGCTDLLGIKDSEGSDIFGFGPTGQLIDSPTCQIPGEPDTYDESSNHLSYGVVSDVFSGEIVSGNTCSRKSSVTVMNADKEASWFVVTYKIESASTGKLLKTERRFINPGQTATFDFRFDNLKCGEPVIYNKCVG